MGCVAAAGKFPDEGPQEGKLLRGQRGPASCVFWKKGETTMSHPPDLLLLLLLPV